MFRSPPLQTAQLSEPRRLADSNRCINPLTPEAQSEDASAADFVTPRTVDFVTSRGREPRAGDAGVLLVPRPATDHGRSAAAAVAPQLRRRLSTAVGVPSPELPSVGASQVYHGDAA